jgi:integrase
MLTGQRIVEILLLDKTQYDRDNAMLDWEETKNGRPHSIPIPRQAVRILDGLVPTKDGRFFPRRYEVNMVIAYSAVRNLIQEFLGEKKNILPFSAVDIRRTWKTLAGAAGIPKEMRDRLQNHARGDVASKHYDRWEAIPEKRAAIALWEEYVDMMLSGDLDKVSANRGQPISLAEARAHKIKAMN